MRWLVVVALPCASKTKRESSSRISTSVPSATGILDAASSSAAGSAENAGASHGVVCAADAERNKKTDSEAVAIAERRIVITHLDGFAPEFASESHKRTWASNGRHFGQGQNNAAPRSGELFEGVEALVRK